jgi:hypothetical protein
MYIQKYGQLTSENGKTTQFGFLRGEKNGQKFEKKLSDSDLKEMFSNIRLNTGFSLPDQLIQDFIKDGSIIPTFKKCTHFNRTDFNQMVDSIKSKERIKKVIPKKQTKKIPKITLKPNQNDKIKKKINKKVNKSNTKKLIQIKKPIKKLVKKSSKK